MSTDDLDSLTRFCATSLDEHLAAHAERDAGEGAVALFQRAAAGVPAYRAFVAERGLDPASVQTAADLARVPAITKETYLREHTLADLCWPGERATTVAVSSGSTGTPTYFPRSLRHEVDVAWRFEQVFRDTLRAHETSTLAIICFPLGTWVGGMFTAACCRLLALKGYPLLVVTAGNQPPEIWRAVTELGPAHEQIVLLGYPPFLKDVVDGGAQHGVDWARIPVSLVLAGEVISEAWRDILHERCGAPGDIERFASSLYGTADAGVLGVESPLCTKIRRLAGARPEVAEAIFGQRRLPTLVQYDPVDRYFEQEGERLLFTGAGGAIPLVRYAIGDTGGVVGYREMLARLEPFGLGAPPEPERELPFVFVFGRSQHAVSFYGANVFVEMARLGLEHADVRARVTGKLVMEVREDAAGDAHLCIDVELARGQAESEGLTATIAERMRESLAATSTEFAGYVPAARQLPEVTTWPYGDPTHFPVGVKHRYVR